MLKNYIKEQVYNSKILIVDDIESNRLILQGLCKQCGLLNIEMAVDGDEAYQKIDSWRPDLVFLDMNMPNVTGLELCKKLAVKDYFSDMAIIIQSSEDNLELIKEFFDLGVVDFISRPFRSVEVSARAMNHLERLLLIKQDFSKYKQLQAEIHDAMVLQSILLPRTELLDSLRENHNLDIEYYYEPYEGLAGDYISVRNIAQNKVAIAIIDVSGHGLSASLYTFAIHSLLQEYMVDGYHAGEILQQLNKKLAKTMPTGKFATIFLAIIDMNNNKLEYSPAASPKPILITAAGNEAVFLENKGFLLGVNSESEYQTISISFSAGDILFLYSDALIETSDGHGHFLSEEELANIILGKRNNNSKEIINTVLARFNQDYASNNQDDLSMIICKI